MVQRAIVSVSLEDEVRPRDLEVPTDVQAERLSVMIAGSMGWESEASGERARYQIEVRPLGRILQADESLEDAGAWDGSWLVFHREGHAPAAGVGFVWRQLD